jgi:type IV pilus assembly protein PilV
MQIHHHPTLPRPGQRRNRGRGFVLLEALVALLIFSMGALALMGLQVTMLHAQTGSKFRADAAFLANDLIGTMWSDAKNLPSYVSCATHAPCAAWSTKVASLLPSGASTLTVNGTTGQVTIAISWQAPNDDLHTYKTETSINPNP